MAAQIVGKSVSEFLSGFSDKSTDSAARVSFKVSFPLLHQVNFKFEKYIVSVYWLSVSLTKLSSMTL
jgi:hypothetical protein